MKTILFGTDCTSNAASTLTYANRFSTIMKADLTDGMTYQENIGEIKPPPLALGFQTQVGTTFLKSDLHAPAHDEPVQDLLGLRIQICREKGGGVKLASRIPHQDPPNREGIKAGGVPKVCARDDFNGLGLASVPVERQPLPAGLGVIQSSV